MQFSEKPLSTVKSKYGSMDHRNSGNIYIHAVHTNSEKIQSVYILCTHTLKIKLCIL